MSDMPVDKAFENMVAFDPTLLYRVDVDDADLLSDTLCSARGDSFQDSILKIVKGEQNDNKE